MLLSSIVQVQLAALLSTTFTFAEIETIPVRTYDISYIDIYMTVCIVYNMLCYIACVLFYSSPHTY